VHKFNLHSPRTARWFVLVLAFLCLAVIFPPSGAAGASASRQDIPSSYALVGENELFQLYVDDTTLAFKLLDKRSGYLWHSGLDEIIEGDRLNNSWQAFARSGISIEYLDARAINRRVSIGNAEHTLEVTPVEQGVSAQVNFTEYGITLGLIVQLEADGVRVEIPFASMHEDNPDFRLGRVYLYPFLGAARGSTIDGYMFLPDGTGSIIRYGDSTRADNMYIGRYYGPDLGMIGIQAWDPFVTLPNPISYPVFGMVHGEGQNAFYSVIEKGAAYGELQVHPAGIITNFNFLYNAFIYNQTYFQATNRSGAGVTTVQRYPNQFDAVIHYRFLTGDAADYVGMARGYQQYLVEQNLLRRNEVTNPDIGVRVEFLGGDKEQVLFWNRFVTMTTVSQMSEILAGLQLPNAEVIYYGWQPYGATSMPPTSMALEGGLGSLSDLRALREEITAAGGQFSLYFDPQSALWREPGYSSRFDLAMSITDIDIEGYGRYYNNYFTLEALQPRYASLSADIAAQLGAGLALDSIGFVLYGDYRNEPPFSRESARAAYQNMLADSPQRLGFYRPNDYMFGIAQAYYDMPLGDNSYTFTTGTVPFLPIVLAGYIPYYGPALNFSSNTQDDLLRQVEYGIYPSYFLSHEPTANMLNTFVFSWLYSSDYNQWGDEVRRTFDWMNALLAPVRGQEIVAHSEITNGVFVTTYANGQQIIVNYTEQPFVQGAITVEAKNALLVENGL